MTTRTTTTVYLVHMIYRHNDANPDGTVIGVFHTEAGAKALRDEKALERIKENDYDFEITEHEVQE